MVATAQLEMQIPPAPAALSELDLMRQLERYGRGESTWRANGHALGNSEKNACIALHSHLIELVSACLKYLMDRTGAREMRTFTMHDSAHGLKVAHLMWHILKPERRERLSPAEIAILVMSAHLHDLGMGLSDAERQARLAPISDIWDKLDIQTEYRHAIAALEQQVLAEKTPRSKIEAASLQLEQAREALLCADTRERHATRERYSEIFGELKGMHRRDPVKIPDVEACLSFDGDSFENKLIDVCISHNEDASVLLQPDNVNPDQPRFSTAYPVGCCVADLRMAATVLRLADILDFDRERTPPVLFHTLLPRSARPEDNRSVLEWSKHLAISNWQIQAGGTIVFRGRCQQAIVHHAVVEFCKVIAEEIKTTRAVYDADDEWPVVINSQVETKIESEGYRYLPYHFTLDEEQIYKLLMGNQIYPSKLDAIRELIQNAVDACQLKDALMRRYHPSEQPSLNQRIVLRYEGSRENSAGVRLSVIDTGVGMDRWIIENYLLKVGRSYYQSSDFTRTRAELRKSHLDFAPVSEFGIGLMSCFMLGERLEIETAAWRAPRGDGRKRILKIDGISRLIEVVEAGNEGIDSMSGTRVSVNLTSDNTNVSDIPSWPEIVRYVNETVIDIPYPIHLEYINGSDTRHSIIEPRGLEAELPDHLTGGAITIPVDDKVFGLKGSIILLKQKEAKRAQAELVSKNRFLVQDFVTEDDDIGLDYNVASSLLRGGFRLGSVPGLPDYIGFTPAATATISVTSSGTSDISLPNTNIARSRLTRGARIAERITEIWIRWLIEHIEEIEIEGFGTLDLRHQSFTTAAWLENYNGWTIYRLARVFWASSFKSRAVAKEQIEKWESGAGEPLRLRWPTSLLHNQLLDLILPLVSELTVDKEADMYVQPPRNGWRESLKQSTDFVSKRRVWPVFVNYRRRIESYIYDDYIGNNWLNRRFSDRFSDFADEDLSRLPRIFSMLANSMKHGTRLRISSKDYELVHRVLAVGPDLKVRDLSDTWTVAELCGPVSLSAD